MRLMPGPLPEAMIAPAWRMEQVPPDRWDEFTRLKRPESVEMWTRSDLIADFNVWCELVGGNGTGEGYPVQLHCVDCGIVWATEATWDDDTEEGMDMYQMAGLDERMRPFVETHAGCRWQLRLASSRRSVLTRTLGGATRR